MIKEAFGIGETVTLAQEEAVKNLPIVLKDDMDVNFEVVQIPVKKTFGLFGGKPAKVRAFVEVSPAELAKDYVFDILKEFNIGDFSIDLEEKEDRVELHIIGDNISPIIGRRGELLDDIQYLAGLVANSGEKDYYRITINAGDYRERREKSLEILASKIAYKSLRLNKKLSLEPMTPYERRVLHKTIENIEGVRSFSEGEGLERHLIVEPTDAKIAADFKKRYYEKRQRFGSKN